MRFERRPTTPPVLLLATPVIAVTVALALSGVLIALAGASVPEAYRQILVGAFGSRLSVTETLARATPLILTGLAAAVAFRVKLWNIGAEGQLYLGAIAVVALGAQWTAGLPDALAIALLFFAAAAAGATLMLGALALRLKFGVDEVVTTLLTNFIVLLFVSMMIEGPLKDPLAFGWPQSVPVADNAELPDLVARSRLHIGLLIAVIVAFAVHFVQSRTVFGLHSRAAGLNAAAARFAGVRLVRTLIVVAALSGGLAGLAGAIQVMGVRGYVATDLSPGFGYSGIVIAMLANLNPIGVIAAALFAAVMFIGADGMSRAIGIPSYIADVAVALSLLTMLVALFFAQYSVRR